MKIIAAEFRPATDYNGKLFKLFLGDFDGRYVKNCDLPVAKKCTSSNVPTFPCSRIKPILASGHQLMKIRVDELVRRQL
jgi:hypothetical protein